MEGEEEDEAACAAADDRDAGFQVLSQIKEEYKPSGTYQASSRRTYVLGRQPPQDLDLASRALALKRPLSVRINADDLGLDRLHRVPLPRSLLQDIACPAVRYEPLSRMVHRFYRLYTLNTSRSMSTCRKTNSGSEWRQYIK